MLVCSLPVKVYDVINAFATDVGRVYDVTDRLLGTTQGERG